MKAEDYEKLIAENLSDLGVEKGNVVLLHSSYKSLGLLVGGPQTVINGFLAALGPEGTLLMPALSYEYVNEANPFFDVKKTPSNVGAIPEHFRKMPGVRRSLHPTHSVCGFGKFAKELLSKHYLDDTPGGKNSPYSLLQEYDGQILLLGCGLEPNTSMHAIEELSEPDYLFGKRVEYELVDYSGLKTRMIYRQHNFSGWKQRYDRVENILTKNELRKGKVLAADCYAIEAPALWDKAASKLRQDPHYFVDAIAPDVN